MESNIGIDNRNMATSSFICAALLLSVCANGVGGQIAQPPPAPPAAFGVTNASVSAATTTAESLTITSIESGTSTAPLPVQQAFVSSVTGNKSIAGGAQTVGTWMAQV